MVNFARSIKPHVIPAVAERFCAQGQRTHCTTGEIWAVRCVFEVIDGQHGKVLRLAEGGVTGHESFYISGEVRDGLLDEVGPWCANAITPRHWDGLVIDAENMTAVRTWAKEKI